MTRLHPPHIATMTEMRAPHKVLERSGGPPVAILKNSARVGCVVPAEAVDKIEHRAATILVVLERMARIGSGAQLVLDDLRGAWMSSRRHLIGSKQCTMLL